MGWGLREKAKRLLMPGGGLDFIPVDFYDGNTMHFGEMTVYPSGGLEFYEPEWNRHFALQVLEDPTLMQILLRTIRADLTVCETDTYTPGPPLDCPVDRLRRRRESRGDSDGS